MDEKPGKRGRPAGKVEGLGRERIMEAALRLLNEKGEAGLSFRNLAGELSVTAMAVKHHAGSRQDLLKALVARAFDGVDEDPGMGEPVANIRQLLENYCDRAVAHSELVRLVFSDMSLLSGPLENLTRRLEAELRALSLDENGVRVMLGLLVDFTHGFAAAAAAYGGDRKPMQADYSAGLAWVLERLSDQSTRGEQF